MWPQFLRPDKLSPFGLGAALKPIGGGTEGVNPKGLSKYDFSSIALILYVCFL